MRKYRQKPEVKEKINLLRKKYNQSPEAKEAARKYRQKPEVKQRRNRAKEARRKIIRKVESFKDITRQWASLKRQRLIADTKRRKNLNNISVKLTPEDILDLIPKDLKCPIYKVPFVFNINSPWNLSFDRIDNNKEYPSRALKHGIQGRVAFRLTLSKEGYLQHFQWLEGNRLFYKSTLASIKRSLPITIPAELSGSAAAFNYELALQYTIVQ
mgnify:CR=1 FL=1